MLRGNTMKVAAQTASNVSPLQPSNRLAISKTLNCHCCGIVSWFLILANRKISSKFSTKQRVFAPVVIAKKNCLRIFVVSMRVISAMAGNPL